MNKKDLKEFLTNKFNEYSNSNEERSEPIFKEGDYLTILPPDKGAGETVLITYVYKDISSNTWKCYIDFKTGERFGDVDLNDEGWIKANQNDIDEFNKIYKENISNNNQIDINNPQFKHQLEFSL